MQQFNLSRSMTALQPGDHACFLYSSQAEYQVLLTQFILDGLERNQKVVLVRPRASGPIVSNDLLETILVFKSQVRRGQLQLFEDKHPKEFEPLSSGWLSEVIQQQTENALAEGWSALRLTVASNGILSKPRDYEWWMANETRANGAPKRSDCLMLCQYDQRSLSPLLLLYALAIHSKTIMGTRLYENPYNQIKTAFSGTLPKHFVLNEWLDWLENMVSQKDADRMPRLTSELWTSPC
jgi:hypothetical protein